MEFGCTKTFTVKTEDFASWLSLIVKNIQNTYMHL